MEVTNSNTSENDKTEQGLMSNPAIEKLLEYAKIIKFLQLKDRKFVYFKHFCLFIISIYYTFLVKQNLSHNLHKSI